MILMPLPKRYKRREKFEAEIIDFISLWFCFQAQSRNNGLLKEAKVVESKVNILNDKQQSQLDISKPCLSIKGNNHDETSQKV